MPTAPTYPGVYIEELPSGVRTITGVATSVAAFLGYFSRGPMNRAFRILNFGDFERAFGGLRADSEASYAIQQFFLNGGGQAYGVRTAADTTASVTLPDEAGVDLLTLTAADPGGGGSAFRASVSHVDGSASNFTLVVSAGAITGTFNNVDIATVVGLVNDPANWPGPPAAAPVVAALEGAPIPPARPAQVGTVGADISGLVLPGGPLMTNDEEFLVRLNGESVGAVTWGGGDLGTLAGVRDRLQTRLRTLAGLGGATVTLANSRLRVGSGTDDADRIALENVGASTLVTDLGLTGASANPQRFALADGGPARAVRTLRDTDGAVLLTVEAANAGAWGDGIGLVVDHDTADPGLGTQFNLTAIEGGTTEVFRNLVMDPTSSRYAVDVVNDGSALVRLGVPTPAPAANALPTPTVSVLSGGADGDPPGAADLIGAEGTKTGIYALLDVDLFNILSIPDTSRLADPDAALVAAAATALAERERAFYILDAPQPANNPLDLPTEIETWLGNNASLRNKNAALYYPRPVVPDPLNDFRPREVAPSGTLAGVYARTDGTRGVWKAPAGTEAVLRGTQRLEYTLTDAENGVLNPLAINALRTFPVIGSVAWGARTLDGADQLASEWKYIPIRRLALYIEESLFRGTQWVVFEPNDETLWAQIRLNVGTFMHTLFRQGAFQGSTPASAYFVKCDAENNPQAGIDRGIVTVTVGFAPLKPAEFVIIQIQQIAGQLEA